MQSGDGHVQILKDILPDYYGVETIADRSGATSILSA